jgi:pimeloyl-ACP methyl ester carboxylesterase
LILSEQSLHSEILRGKVLFTASKAVRARSQGAAGWILHALLTLAVTLLMTGCTDLFFYPDRAKYRDPSALDLKFEEVELPSEGGKRLFGWDIQPVGNNLGTVLFLHGNAGNISTHLPTPYYLASAGYRVLTFDYAGYGGSSGRSDIYQLHDDVEIFFDYIQRVEPHQSRRILFGQSLGASLGLTVASAPQAANLFCAIVADSPFAGYRSIVRDKLKDLWIPRPLAWILSLAVLDRYSPERVLSQGFPTPVLFYHFTDDKIVPAQHSRQLCERVSSRCTLVIERGIGHSASLVSAESRHLIFAWMGKQCGRT